MDQKLPSLYHKADGKFYFTFKGKQYYGGSTMEKATQKLLAVVGSGNSHGPYPITDAIKEYLNSIEGIQSPDSIVTKRRTYNRVFSQLTCVSNVFDITPQRLETYRSELLKSLEKSTINTIFNQLSAFLHYFVEKGILVENPAKKLGKLRNYVDPSPDYITDEEKKQLMSFCERGRTPYVRQRDRLLFTLILNAGLRRIELAHLKWSDIDFEKRVLIVREGKGGKHRLVAINDTLFDMLNEFPRRRSDFVLTTTAGTPITRQGLSAIALKYVNRLNHHYQGRKRFSLHSLRATFATTLCEKGVSTRVVQSLLGHSDPKTTMRYAACSDAALVDAVGRLV